jgi:hypothetical protein
MATTATTSRRAATASLPGANGPQRRRSRLPATTLPARHRRNG